MFPGEIAFGITWYDIFFALGLLTALVMLRILSDKIHLDPRLFNFTLLTGVGAIILGVLSAILFQAFYNYEETGIFEINKNTGMTFYGGLIGGASFFLLIYLGAGHFVFKDNLHIKKLMTISDAAACSIAVAHATGRLGCFSAGCCHGIHADPPWGVYMEFAGDTVLPVQLYESLFLYLLDAFLIWRFFKKRPYNLPCYMVVYGIWRFCIEYIRGDDRGATFIPFLTPSQLTAVLLVIGGIVLFIFERRSYNKREKLKAENEDAL